MSKFRKLFETPVVLKSGGLPFDFGADTGTSIGVLASTEHYDLAKTGDDHRGELCALSKNLEITFRVEFETQTIPNLGTGVVQVSVWREPSFVHTIGLPETVLFGYLLPIHKMMISDEVHTDQGQRFWLRMMGLAVERGLEIGMIDLGDGTIRRYAPGPTSVSRWATELLGGWGHEPQYGAKRFFIRTK